MMSLEEKWLERYMQLSFMHVCKYLNQKVRQIGDRMENLSRVFQNQKRKKNHEETGYHMAWSY